MYDTLGAILQFLFDVLKLVSVLTDKQSNSTKQLSKCKHERCAIFSHTAVVLNVPSHTKGHYP